MFTITRQRKTFLVVMAAAAVVVLCCGCSDNGIGGAFYDISKAPAPYTTSSFTDSRDGKTYKTTKVGNNEEWMAENLKHETAGSWCYGQGGSAYDKNGTWRTLSPDEINAYCAEYGRLYNWETAKTACPSGWRLPSRGEWDDLIEAAGGKGVADKKLKAKSGWNRGGNGSDDFEFSALPGGYRYYDGDFYGASNYGYWWTATEDDENHAYYRDMNHYYVNVFEYCNVDYVLKGYCGKSYGYSVRCVKN